MSEEISSLCRICLQAGATLPIFDKSKKAKDLHSKLSQCVCEKVEDVDGFPRLICLLCNDTLETLYNFILKFKETCKFLENGLLIVKKEKNVNSDSEHNDLSEVEIEVPDIKDIKAECDDHFESGGISDYEDDLPLNVHKKLDTKTRSKRERQFRKQSAKTQTGHNTNKIASSILEGSFYWNGEKWCVKIGNTILKKVKKEPLEDTHEIKKRIPKLRPQTKVKVPNVKTITEPKLCDLCGDVFKTQDKLNKHKKFLHYKNPVQCPKCPRMLANNSYLKKHIERKHEGTREFICATCGRAFMFKGDLASHLRNTHNRVKPKKKFPCQFCDKTYACQKSATVHERSVHTGQRPAVCEVCGSSFFHEDYLKEHMRLHTGETPFKCPICGRGYAQRGNMKSHMRNHRISDLDAVTLSKLRPNYLKLLKL